MRNVVIDFSVVILLYNGEEIAMKHTVDSVLNQKGCTYEIILADDCSTNSCLQETKAYLEEKGCCQYKVVAHPKNVGTVRNISDALQQAKGQYVKCIGVGDMLYDEHTLSDIAAYMKQSDCAMCFGKTVSFYWEEEQMRKVLIPCPADIKAFRDKKTDRINRNIIQNHGWIIGVSMYYNTAKYIQYLEEILDVVRYCEDLLQVILLLHGEEIGYYPYPVVYYEVGSGISTNAGNGNSGRMLQDHNTFWETMAKCYPNRLLVQKGAKMQQYQSISQASQRQRKIIIHNFDYVLMCLRTRFQKKLYQE